jgi:hypothetical protein
MAQKGLIKNSTLEQLNISDNRIQDSGARALALAFESNKSIELLNITGNGIADEGVSVLMQVFFLFNLTSFRLGSCCADIPHPPLLLQASSGNAPRAAGGFHIRQRVQSRGTQSHRRCKSSESVADGVRVMKFRRERGPEVYCSPQSSAVGTVGLCCAGGCLNAQRAGNEANHFESCGRRAGVRPAPQTAEIEVKNQGQVK